VTTSGTAVAELFPAIMEASYSGVPLVAITADRPASYRGSGAPQSVYQPDIFGDHVAESYDFSAGEFIKPALFSDCPIHINICFEEPLIDDKLEKKHFNYKQPELKSGFDLENFNYPENNNLFKRPLVILGQIKEKHREFVRSCLLELGAPVYAEAHSGLREDAELRPYIIQSGEYSFRPTQFNKYFDSVVRVGGVPTLRLWRDLEAELINTPVASFSSLPFSGLSRCEQVSPIEELPSFLQSLDVELSQFDGRQDFARLQEAISNFPESEVSLLSNWAQNLQYEANVFIGNSLPIREWELAQNHEFRGLHIYSNRGVNGIDGLIATACGVARGTGRKTFVVIGDLSALYDLSSLALVTKMKSLVKLVIINNGGGMIFNRLFKDPLFENRHSWSFANAGAMFGLSEEDITEICPDNVQSQKFWDLYHGEAR
jgi:2-succinyl-5-enolpyruvyl-6-hydroxy-3-cyclohexene-1-carboxylate synthase